MLQAVLNALQHQGGDFFIQPQRLGDVKTDAWMLGEVPTLAFLTTR